MIEARQSESPTSSRQETTVALHQDAGRLIS
jgi:hypothetical protein